MNPNSFSGLKFPTNVRRRKQEYDQVNKINCYIKKSSSYNIRGFSEPKNVSSIFLNSVLFINCQIKLRYIFGKQKLVIFRYNVI